MKTMVWHSGLCLIVIGLFLAGCEKNSLCEETAISSLAGNWDGIITTTLYRDSILQYETVENATIIFNKDYTGSISTIRTFINFPIDTTLEVFEYSYAPEARVLDIVMESAGTPENPEKVNYSQPYDVLRLGEALEAVYERRSANVYGERSEYRIRWQLQRR